MYDAQYLTQRKGFSAGIIDAIVDPRFYFTIALLAGEAGLPFFPFNSGWMFLLAFVGMLLMLVNGKIRMKKTGNVVFLMYLIILLRNITLEPEVLYEYEIPNLGTAIILLVIFHVYSSTEDIVQIEKYFFFYASVLSFLGLVLFIHNPSERLAVFGGPNGYYKITLLFEVLCFYRYLYRKKRKYLFFAVIGCILCVATGSKGGIVAMGAVLSLEMLFYIYNAGKKRKQLLKRIGKILVILIAASCVLSVVINRVPALQNMFSRAASFLFSENVSELTSVSSRTELIDLGMRFFRESPIFGKGARYTYFYTKGGQPYPHNLFVELLSEQGIVGTIPLVLFFLNVFCKAWKYGKHDRLFFCLFLCLVVYFSGSMFSGNILDAKPIFVFGLLLCNLASDKKRPII